MEAEDHSDANHKRLVLCFDGTGNQFLGNESDTNIVKLYQMLDRKVPDQYHYYQPGIGTYVQNQTSNGGGGIWGKIKSFFITKTDEAIGTSFVHHVVAGYQFLMRYYSPGDHIYIFGFSRGAYTARFLAQMVHDLGLLSRGNEEMVHFAWTTFSNWQRARGKVPQGPKERALEDYMLKFNKTFCRPDIRIHFLGLFDCVNSVGQFEIPLFRKSFNYITTPPADIIRHAVSIHERRLKFKPALFIYDVAKINTTVDVEEVWFAGNHGDVGGGWERRSSHQQRLLSDTPLTWMVEEVLKAGGSHPLSFLTTEVESLAQADLAAGKAPEPSTSNESAAEQRKKDSQPHDMLGFRNGASIFKTMGWWIIEILPFFTRLELEHGKWVPRHWPPNMGATRDIPTDATVHPSVQQMHQAGILSLKQMPRFGGDEPALLTPSNAVEAMKNHGGKNAAKVNGESGGKGKTPNGTSATNGDASHAVTAKDWGIK